MFQSFRSAVADARRHGSLHFAALLPQDRIEKAFGRARWLWQGWIYTPAVTVWGFLSQCLSADHSCRDAVARLIAWRLACGDERQKGGQGGGVVRTKRGATAARPTFELWKDYSEAKGGREDVVTVVDYELIRRKRLLDGQSGRSIAKELGHSRKTVAKALAHPVPPGYRRKGPKKRPAIEPFRAWIDAWLEEDQSRPRKQRHTAERIYERLRAEHGYARRVGAEGIEPSTLPL
jgi:hypothetical protein